MGVINRIIEYATGSPKGRGYHSLDEPKLDVSKPHHMGEFKEDVPLMSHDDVILSYDFVVMSWAPTRECSCGVEWGLHKNGRQVVYRCWCRPRLKPQVDVEVKTPLLKNVADKKKYTKKTRELIVGK